MRNVGLLPVILVSAAVSLAACNSNKSAAPVSDDPQVQAGYQLITQRGCTSCHSVTGATRSGPTWKGLAGSTVTLDDNTTTVVDDAYLKRALAAPDAQIQKGFRGGIMATVLGNQDALTDEQQTQIVAYINSLK